MSEFGLSPIMWRVRFLRKAILSLPGVVVPGARSHGLRVMLPSRSTSMHRPPINSTSGRYESPRSRIEISGFSLAIISRNSIAMKVLPPPEAAMISMFASASDESHGENGTS